MVNREHELAHAADPTTTASDRIPPGALGQTSQVTRDNQCGARPWSVRHDSCGGPGLAGSWRL